MELVHELRLLSVGRTRNTHLEAENGPLPEFVEQLQRGRRELIAENTDAVPSYRCSPSLAEWIGVPPHDFHPRFSAPERLGLLLIIERAGDIIGDLMVKIGDAWAPPQLALQARGVQAELGWALRPEETGQGYATEAVQTVLRICFDELCLRRVTASCFAANNASSRLMERVGMRLDARTVADTLHPSGRWMDGCSYALLADEWRSRCTDRR